MKRSTGIALFLGLLMFGGCASNGGDQDGLSGLLGGSSGGSGSGGLFGERRDCVSREATCTVSGQQPGEACFCNTSWGFIKGVVR